MFECVGVRWGCIGGVFAATHSLDGWLVRGSVFILRWGDIRRFVIPWCCRVFHIAPHPWDHISSPHPPSPNRFIYKLSSCTYIPPPNKGLHTAADTYTHVCTLQTTGVFKGCGPQTHLAWSQMYEHTHLFLSLCCCAFCDDTQKKKIKNNMLLFCSASQASLWVVVIALIYSTMQRIFLNLEGDKIRNQIQMQLGWLAVLICMYKYVEPAFDVHYH